ncbi:autotransporter domain-containing protein [uncultured Desulfovibrio sp.]|uniref:autotransporter domain-containing protein n=1 Tax=uncultured Desulfovibrio sp. TaxID=167968 RepID=UPI00261D2382|nr:autotransporter domain-containing protein [uncultured Desulfovibrio sp.]
MQLTKGAIGNLINRYKAVLKKCHLMNTFGSLAVAGMLVMGGAGMAVAGAAGGTTEPAGKSQIVINKDSENKALTGTYKGYGHEKGGVISVSNDATGVTITNSSFTGNKASVGGAIFNDGQISITGTTFDNNIANQVGGALSSTTTPTASTNISNSVFTNNHSVYDGGAIGNYSGLKLENCLFEGNTAQLAFDAEKGTWTTPVSDNTAVGGGAISLGAVSTSSVASISGTTFKNNTSGTNGGAIATRQAIHAKNSAAKLDIAATFIGNKAQQGGAIYNSFYTDNGLGKGAGVTVTGTFSGNEATGKGGAIYNDGTLDQAGKKGGIMTITDATFDGNKADFGGAIFNTGTLTINGGSFEGNTATKAAGAIYNAADAQLTVDGVTFANNSSAKAGAINNYDGTVAISDSTFKGNDAGKSMGGAVTNTSGSAPGKSIITITGSTFEGNKAGNGGAVWNGTYGQVDITDSTFKGNTALAEDGLGQGGAITNANAMTITGGSFANNTANYSGGAIYNGAHAAPGKASLTIDGTTFTGNSVTADFNTTKNDNIAGGAIFNDTGAELSVKNATFTDNTSSLKGGAIFNRDGVVTIENSTFKGNSVPTSAGGAVLNESGNTGTLGTINITGSTFEGNTAGNGGAVWNGSNGKVEIADSTFKGNTALAGIGQGGAITNANQMTITGSTFEGNQAGKIGGAIFNAANGKLDFNGTNTFTNNTAAGKANDIYNAGTITVKDGTTTLNSGLILAAGSQTDVSGGALVINGTTTWEKGDTFGSLTVKGGALTLQKGDVLEGYDKAKGDTSLSVTSGALYLINNSDYTAKNFTEAKGALNVTDASFGFVGGTLVDEDNKVTDLVVSGHEIKGNTTFETTGLESTTVNNSSFLKNDLTVKADTNAAVTINGADVAVNKVNIETSAAGDKSLTINNDGSLTVVGGDADDKLIAANGTEDLKKINVDAGELNLGSAAMPERGAGTLGAAEIALGNSGSLNASNGDYTVGDVTGTGEVTADAGANLNTGKIEAQTVTADAANIKATGDVKAGDINLVKGGSVTSGKNITVTGPIANADGTLQAGENITAAGQDLKQADNGKLTVAAGGTIKAANISATNVTAKTLAASGAVAVDGGTLNLTGTGDKASSVKSLELTNGTQATVADLKLDTDQTLTVGTGDDTAGGTTLSAQHIDLNGGMLLVDPAWGLASSNVAVKDLSALSTSGAASADPALVNGSVGVGQNSYLALRTDDLTWLPGVVANYTKGVGLSETGITAALGVFDSIKIADTKGLVVDGRLTSTGLSAAIVPDTAKFGANSLLVVNGANIYGDKAAITFMSTSGGTLTVDKTSRLVVTDAVAGQDYTIVANAATVQDGTSAPITDGRTVWKTEGLSTTTDMISLGDAKHDDTNDKVSTTASRNDAHTVFPNLSDGMANAVNDLYTGHAGAAGKPHWDYADVNSADMGVRFLSRATDNRFLGMDKEAAAATIESAARIAFAGAVPQMTKMASDAGTNAVVNRLGFADPADGAQAMDADGKIVDRNTTGFALWIAPLWQSQHGWGMDADSMDYGFNGNLGGVSLGADYTFENAIRAGITFNIGGGYAESSGGDLSSTDNRMNFWGLGAYAGWNYENFGVMADVSYTSTWNDLKQDVDSRMGMGDLEADVQATAISAGLRAEYLLQTSAMDIIPHIGVRYMSLNTWGYDVDTHGGTVLEGDSLHQDIWTFPIGVTFSKDIALDSGWNFKPSLDFSVIPAAGDIKAKHDVHFTGLPGTYEVETQMMDYLTWQGGVGLELANDNMSIGVNYTLQAGQHTTGHGVFGSFRYEF